jgi:hypothetical protein
MKKASAYFEFTLNSFLLVHNNKQSHIISIYYTTVIYRASAHTRIISRARTREKQQMQY